MNGNRHDVFLDFDCILILTLAVEKLLKSGHMVINDFLLSLQLGCENDIYPLSSLTTGTGPLAKCVDVNAETHDVWRVYVQHTLSLTCSNQKAAIDKHVSIWARAQLPALHRLEWRVCRRANTWHQQVSVCGL